MASAQNMEGLEMPVDSEGLEMPVDSEGLEMPVDSDQIPKEDLAAVQGSTSKLKKEESAKAKLTPKPSTGNQAKAGSTGSKPPISGRTPLALRSKVASGGQNKIAQEQRVSKTLPGSGTSSHAKIMEKKLAARGKATQGNETGACGANGPVGASGRPNKVLLTNRGKNPSPQPRSNVSSVLRQTTAVTKLPVTRPDKLPQNKLSRPDCTPPSNQSSTRSAGAVRKQPALSSHSTLSAGAARKPAAPRVPHKRQSSAPLGAAPTGDRPRKTATVPNSAPQSKHPSLEVNKANRSTKPKPVKVTALPPIERKKLNVRLKGQIAKVPIKSAPWVQQGTPPSKIPNYSNHQQSTKSSEINVETQSLPNEGMPPSREPHSESDLGETGSAGLAGLEASSIRPTDEILNENIPLNNPQGPLIIEVPSPQGAQTAPGHSTTRTPVEEEKLEDERVEENSCSRPLLQLTKSSEVNVETQSLTNKVLAPSRKSLWESDIEETGTAGRTGVATPMRPTEVPTLAAKEETPNQTVAVKNPQGYLAIGRVPSPQGEQAAPCHGNTHISVEEEKLEDEEVEANSCTAECGAAEYEGEVGSAASPSPLNGENEGGPNGGWTMEVDLCSNEVQNEARVNDGNEYCGTSMYLNTLNADQVHVGEKVTSINGEMDLNNVNLQPRDLQEQHHLPQSSSASSEGASRNGARVSPMKCVSVIKDGSVVPVPMAASWVDLKEPTLGSCLERSPETDCNISNVKLTMYQYSEEADTEDSPNELFPESLQSPEDQCVPEPKSLLVTCKMEDSVGNWPSEEKLGISPEDWPADQGVSKSSTLSGHDLAGKSSSITSTPEELKDYDSSSGVESKSDEKPESADLFIQQTELSPPDDLLDQDLGIHLERGDADPETLAADDLHGDPPTEPMMSSEEEDHSEEDCPGVTEHIQCGLEGIDNPVFEDKTTSDSNLEVLSQCAVSHFKPSTLHALDENEELVPVETPHSLEHGYTASDSLAPQSCCLSGAGSSEDPTCDQTPVTIGLQPCGPPVSLSTPGLHLPPNESSSDSVPGVTLALHHVPGDPADDDPGLHHADDLTVDGSDQSKSRVVDDPAVAECPIDCLYGELINLQLNDPTIDANGGHMWQQYYSACEKNGSTGLLSEGDPTLQTPACVPWMAPPLPPFLSTIYEVETAEETRLEDVEREEAGNPAADWQCLELIDDPGEKVLHLQIEQVEVVQQLINQTLLLSGDGVKLQSKVMVDKAELSKWTDLLSPLDDSTASVTSVTSFSPEDISSSQGEWTVVELETHH